MKRLEKVLHQANLSGMQSNLLLAAKELCLNDNIIIEATNDIKLNIKGKEDTITIKGKDEIRDEKILVEMFNNHYVNIVEKTSGSVPKSIGNSLNPDEDRNTVADIIESYKNHPSITKIKEKINYLNCFDFPKATVEDISSIIKSLNPKKATGPDSIPIKIIKAAANVIDSHLCNIINKDLEKNRYSEDAKTALVRPIYKKK